MAKGDGRVAWIAWPAGIACAVVVAGLVWLAAPGIPGAIDFIGSTLRSATSAPEADGAGAAPAEPATDCRGLYPDRLWAELTWTPEVLLSQNGDPPATTTALTAALAPQVRFTCRWTTEDERSISTTVATVGGDAAAVAQAALTADGFACTQQSDTLLCARSRDGVEEEHALRGDTWVSSVLDRWSPQDYGPEVAAHALPR